jgi:hypothetical protein
MMNKPLLSGVMFNSLEVMLYAMIETNNQMNLSTGQAYAPELAPLKTCSKRKNYHTPFL